MTSILKLSRTWDKCPQAWRNFVDYINYDSYMPESVFWLVIREYLAKEFNAYFLDDPIIIDNDGSNRYDVRIQFNEEHNFTLFLLRWA